MWFIHNEAFEILFEIRETFLFQIHTDSSEESFTQQLNWRKFFYADTIE